MFVCKWSEKFLICSKTDKIHIYNILYNIICVWYYSQYNQFSSFLNVVANLIYFIFQHTNTYYIFGIYYFVKYNENFQKI